MLNTRYIKTRLISFLVAILLIIGGVSQNSAINVMFLVAFGSCLATFALFRSLDIDKAKFLFIDKFKGLERHVG